MPYAEDFAGIYRVVDTSTGRCYIGQSRRLKKRIAEHFRLLGKGLHPNRPLQSAYALRPGCFEAHVEVYVHDPSDMDVLEEAFLSGEARFDDSPLLFNISSTARTPMSGRNHTQETRQKISAAKRGRTEHVTPEYREKLRVAHLSAALSDPEYRAKVKFIVENPQLSYAERGRRAGVDTSRARKIALKYRNRKDLLDG